MNELDDLHHSCPNCGFQLSNRFCANCGQKLKTDYTLVSIFRDFGEVIWGTDSRMGQTIKDYLQPGLYLSNWLNGKQARYISPVKMFLLLNLIYFLVISFGGFNTFVNDFHSHLTNQYYSDGIYDAAINGISASEIAKEDFIAEFDSRVFGISNTMIIIMTLMYSFQFALLNLRKRRYLYEHIISGFYFSGYLLIIMIVLNISYISIALVSEKAATVLENDHIVGLSITALLCVLAFFIQKKFYKDSLFLALVKGFLIGFLFTMYTIFMYRYLLFWITYYGVMWF